MSNNDNNTQPVATDDNAFVFEQWIRFSDCLWAINIRSNSPQTDNWWELSILQLQPDRSPENTPDGMYAYLMSIEDYSTRHSNNGYYRPLFECTYFCYSFDDAKFDALNKLHDILQGIMISTECIIATTKI